MVAGWLCSVSLFHCIVVGQANNPFYQGSDSLLLFKGVHEELIHRSGSLRVEDVVSEKVHKFLLAFR